MTNDDIPAVRAIQQLINTGEWNRLPGPPDMVVLVHVWPDGSADTLGLRSETDALAERTSPVGVPVWREFGPVTDVIIELRRLPPPWHPDAPHEPFGNASHTDRDMGLS